MKETPEHLRLVAIHRAPRFAPNSTEKDRTILRNVAAQLPWPCHFAEEDDACSCGHADIFLSMGRAPETLRFLQEQEVAGAVVVNTPASVLNCRPSCMTTLLRDNGFPVPPESTGLGWWLKRGDGCAQTKDDVVFCPDEKALERMHAAFRERGISQTVTSAHVKGDLVKFYAAGEDFFRLYYPTDDGISKFGNEVHNGVAHHYAFNMDAFKSDVFRIAKLMGLSVYGGDAIVREDGSYCFFDINDWPSFSRCADEAGKAIGQFILSKICK